MDSYADMCCVLKVNAHCMACKMKVMEVLSSICGVFSVTIDAAEGMAKVSGEVDPNVLLGALVRSGKHAEMVRVKLKSPAISTNYSYHNKEYGYEATDRPYQYRRSMSPERSSRYAGANQHYPARRQVIEYSSWYTTKYRFLSPSTVVDRPNEYNEHFDCCGVV